VSGEAATLRASVDAARAEADAARRVHARDQALLEQGIVSRQDMETSQARSLAADATARAAAAQLQTAGSPDASGRVTIASPIAGIVGSVGVAPGGVVAAGALIAQVTDPAQTELVFNASPAAAAQITAGMPMQVHGLRGSFEATVVGVAADISETGGATLVRATGAAADLPPAGSPVAGVVVVSAQSGTATVPADAVQTVEGRSVVFVASETGFRATPVLAGRRAGGRIEVLNGLSGDERIAGANAFLLKAELAKGDADHDH
jgi:cobalt-zinc-cadmium efflux system membrane fusion protein